MFVGLGSSLVGFLGSGQAPLLLCSKWVLLIEIRQRSSAWTLLVENTNRTKSLFFSNLRHIEQDKVDVYVFCLNLTWVIGSNNEHECSIKLIGQIKFLNLMEG
jgi:hypothetical protein